VYSVEHHHFGRNQPLHHLQPSHLSFLADWLGAYSDLQHRLRVRYSKSHSVDLPKVWNQRHFRIQLHRVVRLLLKLVHRLDAFLHRQRRHLVALLCLADHLDVALRQG